jgi:transcriptional regulator with XRE-family HTH domain
MEHADDGTPGQAVPVRHISIDQIVAANMRHWRRAAGMTQEELGRKLGLSAPNVSAIESSAGDGRDPRRFNAEDIANLSLALSVPAIALLLPPEDDGREVTYIFTGPGGEHDMQDLMTLVVMTDSDDQTPVMKAYRDRMMAAVGRYCDESWKEEVARWLSDASSEDILEDRIARLRSEHEAALRGVQALGAIVDAAEQQRGKA